MGVERVFELSLVCGKINRKENQFYMLDVQSMPLSLHIFMKYFKK